MSRSKKPLRRSMDAFKTFVLGGGEPPPGGGGENFMTSVWMRKSQVEKVVGKVGNLIFGFPLGRGTSYKYVFYIFVIMFMSMILSAFIRTNYTMIFCAILSNCAVFSCFCTIFLIYSYFFMCVDRV